MPTGLGPPPRDEWPDRQSAPIEDREDPHALRQRIQILQRRIRSLQLTLLLDKIAIVLLVLLLIGIVFDSPLIGGLTP